jgi:hypothetical protein
MPLSIRIPLGSVNGVDFSYRWGYSGDFLMPHTEQLLAADVIQLEGALTDAREENQLLRVMLSEALEIAHQAIARLWQQTLERKA